MSLTKLVCIKNLRQWCKTLIRYVSSEQQCDTSKVKCMWTFIQSSSVVVCWWCQPASTTEPPACTFKMYINECNSHKIAKIFSVLRISAFKIQGCRHCRHQLHSVGNSLSDKFGSFFCPSNENKLCIEFINLCCSPLFCT